MTQRRLGIVKEIQPEIKESARYHLAIDAQVMLRQMPAARPNHKDGRLLGQDIMLARVLVAVIHGAAPAVTEIDLSADEIIPNGRI